MKTALFILLTLCIVALLQRRVLEKVALKRVDFSRSISTPHAFEGEWVDLTEVIHNDKALPLPWLRVECRLSPNLRTKSSENEQLLDERFFRGVYTPGPYQQITRVYGLKCLKRGYYDLSTVSLTAGDLFGLGCPMGDRVSPAYLTVWPKPAEPRELPQNVLQWQGDVTVRRWIDPDPLLISGIRDYQPGDNRRDVHWKATAKTGSMQVKTYEYTVSPKLLLVLDMETQRDMEPAIKAIAYLASWALKSGFEAGFFSNGGMFGREMQVPSILPGRSSGQLEEIYESLGRLRYLQRESLLATVTRLVQLRPSKADILIFTSQADFRVQEKILDLRALGCSVTTVEV